ncbi:MAG TPA: SDR family oxidoreductase [Bacillota bacterium]|nr:SDR family oxidoreductase [Bacillota bacterium]
MPTVAITGAGSGLGRSLALTYSKHGYKVFLLGRSGKKLHLVRHEIIQNNGEAEVIICDVKEYSSVKIAFQQIDTLDVFINSAGVGVFGPLEAYSHSDIDVVLQTNVKGTIFTIQAALPLIQKNNGRMLTIISTAGLRGKVNESIYCASKYAVRGFTESLQEEWKDADFSITAVYMGGMDTPFWRNSSHVKDTSHLQSPHAVAQQIYREDDGRKEIIIQPSMQRKFP